MIHGFLILTYGAAQKTLEQVNRLQADNHRFFIHYDRKTTLNEADDALKSLRKMKNVTILPDEARVRVQWGSIRIVEATLNLIKAALKDQSIDYLHLLSGECLHVKSVMKLDEYMEQHRGREFIQWFAMPPKRTGGWGPNRYDKYHLTEHFNPRSKQFRDVLIRNLNSGLRVLQRWLKKVGVWRKLPANFPEIFAGSAWWTLSRECCQYILDYLDHHPEYMRRFRHTQLPDEMFFHSIILNSPFRDKVVNHNLRFIPFRSGTNTYANNVMMEDLADISKEDILFARKFNEGSRELLQYLEQHVY